MSLDNIQLVPITVQELFKNSLIELNKVQPILETAAQTAFSILGKNQKKILILVDNTEAIYLPDEALNFLLGILGACKLSMEDVGILNFNKNQSITYQTIATGLEAEKVFLFGISPAQIALPLSFPHYQIQRYNGQVYLTAPPLSSLQNDKGEKTKLWNSLKQIFSL
jgi:hypothetical protein